MKPTQVISRKQGFLLYSLPLYGWLATMILFSSLPGDSLPEIPVWNWDKLAHTAEYVALAFLFMRFLCYAQSFAFARSVRIVLIAGVLYAALDELHQLFIPLRSCNWYDYCADVVGIFLGVWLAAVLYRRQRPA
jgi:VanZ family protein